MELRGISLAAWRVNAGLRKKEVASEIGVTVGTLYNWEHGLTEPKMSHVKLLAKLYGVTLDELLCGKEGERYTDG